MVVDNERPPLTEDEVDRIFGALADATRRDIIRRTLTEEISVSDLARAYDMSFAAVQKHVATLEDAGLVTKIPYGRRRLVRSDPALLQRTRSLLERYEKLWRARINALDDLLAAD